ncbi:unnamed protein product, partial [Amoebophrya sp. A25]|eukprot:GSA25T00004198001.1
MTDPLPILVLREKNHSFYADYEECGYRHVTTTWLDPYDEIWDNNDKTLFRFSLTPASSVKYMDVYRHCQLLKYVPWLAGGLMLTAWTKWHANEVNVSRDFLVSTLGDIRSWAI